MLKKTIKVKKKEEKKSVSEFEKGVLRSVPTAVCLAVKDKHIVLREKQEHASDFTGALCGLSKTEEDAWKKALRGLM